jgi:DNA repair protein RadC
MTPREERLVKRATAILRREFERSDVLNSPGAVRAYLAMKLSLLEREVFGAIYLDSQNRVIHHEHLFTGTLTQTAVYPREVVKSALRANAAGVCFFHNHPSGVQEPSHADRMLTAALKTSLAVVDIQVLDHIILAAGTAYSFAENGGL